MRHRFKRVSEILLFESLFELLSLPKMKLHWETEDLIDCWTLLAPEQEVIANKTGVTRLGFAVLLKFFALEGQFPRSISEIPQSAVEFIAKQVAVEPEEFSEYRLHGRTASYHRTQIRDLFDYQEASAEDAKRLSLWGATKE